MSYARRREFRNRTQGDKSMAEYEAEFLRLKRYTRSMVASEYEKCVHFKDGLRDSLMILITPRGKRERPKKWARPNGPVRVEVLVASIGIQPCGDYGRRHLGECGRRLGDCLGHRFYTLLVASTIFRNLEISIECTSGEITVLSLLGQSIWVSRLYWNVSLEVQGVVFLTNLMELPFGEFDLILGLDWLVEHRVSLDCTTKRVVLRTEDDKEVVVISECRDYLSNVISALMAEKLVRKGFGHIWPIIVREFWDVFPDELLGLPPNREVEFGIELLPGIALMSIAPYPIAPKELTELKAQLQELLDYGFIHPSVSL
ncbi:uncharacterized protein [Gossypium hirsutum]|uniref:Uncharacterized protein n=1 Tax=Gossypium hirsutum TaxID=3635 RepID=A0A1U8LPJ8_GOSHI|nr:uncharacterized protein LOC107928629 [Gossypium hirsutum]